MVSVDLNADLGEGAGTDRDLMPLITSTSVACGGHTGDRSTMAEVAALAAAHGVVVGAHPSYPDRAGFGRRDADLPLDELARTVAAQVRALMDLAPVRFLKAHGALYNRAAIDRRVAEVLARVAGDTGLVLLCPGSSEAAAAADRAGVVWRGEAFADRAYGADGRLVARSQPGAVIDDPAVVTARAVALVTKGGVGCIDGGWIPVAADSLCLHGDTPGAVELARSVRAALEGAGVEIRPFV